MALYQDGILISGANTLPQMTLAEYNALPADKRPTYWERLDADYDDVLAPKTDIATVESGTTASRAYSVGELVYVSGTLYRVKTAIASGATFTVGTNVEVTNVSNAIEEVNAKLDRGSVSVTADGVKTVAQLYNELFALVDMSKVTVKSKFVDANAVFNVSTLIKTGTPYVVFTNDSVYTNTAYTVQPSLYNGASKREALAFNISNNTMSYSDDSSAVYAAGRTVEIEY